MAHQLHERVIRRCFQEGNTMSALTNLVPIAFFVDSAIYVPHRLTAHLLCSHVNGHGFPDQAPRGEIYLAELPPRRDGASYIQSSPSCQMTSQGGDSTLTS